MTITVRGTEVTSCKHPTIAGLKAAFQLYLNKRYNCTDAVSAAWVINEENHAEFGITGYHLFRAFNTFGPDNNFPKKIEL